MNILKEIVLNQLIKIPAVKNAAKKYHETGLGSNAELINSTFDNFANETSIKNKDLLELGAGKTLDIAVLAKKHGAASVTIVDVERYLDDDQLMTNDIKYVIYDGKQIPLPNSSVDLIWSNDVYEHIRFPEITISENYRLLRQGGIAAHLIDLQDHFSYGKNSPELSFNCLKYSETIWNLMTWNRSNYVNRLRATDWIELHKSIGFKIISSKFVENKYIKDNYLTDESLKYLRKFSDVDAIAGQIQIIVKK